MKKLLSVPASLVTSFHAVQGLDHQEWFVVSDPPKARVGSGGGTAHVLVEEWRQSAITGSLADHLGASKRVILHAGGQSRRLPAYAPSGKLLTPLPVFRWAQGQRIDQTLLGLQLPLLERLASASGPQQNLLVASGDVLVMAPRLPRVLPQADVVCLGLWVEPELATRHGVFFAPRTDPSRLEFMLQKPSRQQLEGLGSRFLSLMDVGLWVLSDRAVQVLLQKSGWQGDGFEGGTPRYYDLYSDFGPGLGRAPHTSDPEVADLTVALVPIEDGGFYHFGTSQELITSLCRIQELVTDQRALWHHRVKPHSSLFVQNAVAAVRWADQHHHVWIENSCIPASWELSDHHVLTGVPDNDWSLTLAPGTCLDVVPLGEADFGLRPYGIADSFQGDPAAPTTLWMGLPVNEWLARRGLDAEAAGIASCTDLQRAPLFPVVDREGLTVELLNWMLTGSPARAREQWLNSPRVSAEELSARANLFRLVAQRQAYQDRTLPGLARNGLHSVFYQLDLRHLASVFARRGLELPPPLGPEAPAALRFRDSMFRAEVARQTNRPSAADETRAFASLSEALLGASDLRVQPQLDLFPDQIVWGRSPARLDLAGGWSDTPPYSIQHGGRVVNLAVNLNGQPPIQVFARRSNRPMITLRSIDNGVSEELRSYEDLERLASPGSAFSVPKAALALAGFLPRFQATPFASLEAQLSALGGGIELSLLSAIPQGSGLGTSSLLAATVLGVLSDLGRLGWSPNEVCHRALMLEQLLTTGGGWQDQYGGVFSGVKLLESEPGWQKTVGVRWLPDQLFRDAETRDQWLLYYTGITRVAKTILAEIVAGMFLNDGPRLALLGEIRSHADVAADALQRRDLPALGAAIQRSWNLNKALDSGTTSPEIEALVARVADRSLGCKLLGAGGGGYLLICAKDVNAARSLRLDLTQRPSGPHARFVEMSLSDDGLRVTRS